MIEVEKSKIINILLLGIKSLLKRLFFIKLFSKFLMKKWEIKIIFLALKRINREVPVNEKTIHLP